MSPGRRGGSQVSRLGAGNHGTDHPREHKKPFPVVFSILFIVFLIVGLLTAPSLVRLLRSLSYQSPDNFKNANVAFFDRLAENEIEILSFSAEKRRQIEQSGFRITIRPIQTDMSRIADQTNRKAHANNAVLVFACYELLHGNEELGRKLLELLKQYDPEIRYNYPTGQEGLLFGDTGANIFIDQFLVAAEKWASGDPSGKKVLEKPASQYEWRKKRYGSTHDAESE